jgi:hypothetical protein
MVLDPVTGRHYLGWGWRPTVELEDGAEPGLPVAAGEVMVRFAGGDQHAGQIHRSNQDGGVTSRKGTTPSPSETFSSVSRRFVPNRSRRPLKAMVPRSGGRIVHPNAVAD